MNRYSTHLRAAFAAFRSMPAFRAFPFRMIAVPFAAAVMLMACEKGGDGPLRRDCWQLPLQETASSTFPSGTRSGYVRSWEYDDRDRPVRMVMRGLEGALIRDSVVAYVDRTAHSTETTAAFVTARRTTFADDALTRLVRDERIQRSSDTGEVSSGSLEERTYDGAGRLIGCKHYGRVFNDYNLSHEQTDYVYEGRTVRYVDRNVYETWVVETIFADDALSCMLRRTTSYYGADAMPARTLTENWEYDAQGRKIGLHTEIDGVLNYEETDFVYSPQRLTYRKTVYLSDGSVYLVTDYEIVYKY